MTLIRASEKGFTLAAIARIDLGVDIVWSILFASFFSLIAAQGVTITASGTFTISANGFGVWLWAFCLGFIAGALYLSVISWISLGFGNAALYLTKDDSQLQRFLVNLLKVAASVDVCVAFVVAFFYQQMLLHIGVHLGAHAAVTLVTSILAWVVTFILAVAGGLVVLILTTMFLFVFTVTVALLANNFKKK